MTGIDVSPDMLAKARDKVARLGLTQVEAISEGDAERLAFPDDSFDAVMALYVASVVSDPARFGAELRRVCKPGGRIVIVNHFSKVTRPDARGRTGAGAVRRQDRLPCRFPRSNRSSRASGFKVHEAPARQSVRLLDAARLRECEVNVRSVRQFDIGEWPLRPACGRG